MKVIIYGRVNHAEDETMSMQVDILKMYCKKQRYKIAGVVTEFGSGEGLGKYIDRFLDKDGANSVDAVIVWNFSRITVDYASRIRLMGILAKKRIRLLSLKETEVEAVNPLWRMKYKK